MEPCGPPLWLTIATSLGTILAGVAAGGAVYVGWQQHKAQQRAAKEQVRLALFDKRYAVMQAVGELLSKAGRHASLDHSDVLELRAKTAMARYLFDDPIIWNLEAITESAIHFVVARRQVERYPPNSPEREAACDREEQLMEWLMSELRILRDKYAPYFSFH